MRWWWVVFALCGTGCLSIKAKPVDTFPNLTVAAGPAGHLSKLELPGVPAEVCDSQGATSYCIENFGQTLDKNIRRLLGGYFGGDGPAFKAVFTFEKFEIGEKSARCGKGVCKTSVPTLVWRFDLVPEEAGPQPIRIPLTTSYSDKPFNVGTYQWKTENKAAESLLKQVITTINAGLSPAN